MASRASRIRPLTFPLLRPSPHSPLLPLHPTRTFTLYPSRPRLPHLLRPTLPTTPHPRPTLHPPTRRFISARTKAYLWRESLIAARIILYGYTALFVTGTILITAALLTTENENPTPSALPLKARGGIALSRTITKWTQNRTAAIETLRDVVSDLEATPSKNPAWISGYLSALKLLAELEELNNDHKAARATWSSIIASPYDGAQWAPIKVAAALRVAKIAEFEQELGAAQQALEAAVTFAVPSRSLDNLPPPGSGENTALLLKALTELGVFHARYGRAELALDLFTRVLAARRSAGPPADPESVEAAEAVGDPCAEAATMTYIGEVLFAMGQHREGVAWSREAFERSVELAGVRGRCRECAIVVGRNLSAMVALMKEEGGKEEKKGWGGFFGKGKREEVVEESPEKWEEAVRVLEGIRATKTL